MMARYCGENPLHSEFPHLKLLLIYRNVLTCTCTTHTQCARSQKCLILFHHPSTVWAWIWAVFDPYSIAGLSWTLWVVCSSTPPDTFWPFAQSVSRARLQSYSQTPARSRVIFWVHELPLPVIFFLLCCRLKCLSCLSSPWTLWDNGWLLHKCSLWCVGKQVWTLKMNHS